MDILDTITKFLFGWAETFEKKGWLLYILVGLVVLILWDMMKGCRG